MSPVLPANRARRSPNAPQMSCCRTATGRQSCERLHADVRQFSISSTSCKPSSTRLTGSLRQLKPTKPRKPARWFGSQGRVDRSALAVAMPAVSPHVRTCRGIGNGTAVARSRGRAIARSRGTTNERNVSELFHRSGRYTIPPVIADLSVSRQYRGRSLFEIKALLFNPRSQRPTPDPGDQEGPL
jgi:hypothetical protein